MRRIRNRIVYKWLGFKARCQRFKRGYADEDVWNMYDWFIDIMQRMLGELANGYSYPTSLTEEEWEEILDDMRWTLWHMDEENIEAELMDEYVNDYKLIAKIKNENKDHFFELFSKWFYYLWD